MAYEPSEKRLQKGAALSGSAWGGLAPLLGVVALVAATLIYLVGDLRSTMGPLAYAAADFLAGPLGAACLAITIYVLRERLAEHAPRRMSLALQTGILAAAAMLLVACIRAANRQYHLLHPDLHLENDTQVLVIWTTLVAGVTAAGWHFWGWALALTGWAGWTSGRLPRGLCALSWLAALASLFVYALPNLEGLAGALSIPWALWLAALVWKAGPAGRLAAE